MLKVEITTKNYGEYFTDRTWEKVLSDVAKRVEGDIIPDMKNHTDGTVMMVISGLPTLEHGEVNAFISLDVNKSQPIGPFRLATVGIKSIIIMDGIDDEMMAEYVAFIKSMDKETGSIFGNENMINEVLMKSIDISDLFKPKYHGHKQDYSYFSADE